jgi:hypothetical protein
LQLIYSRIEGAVNPVVGAYTHYSVSISHQLDVALKLSPYRTVVTEAISAECHIYLLPDKLPRYLTQVRKLIFHFAPPSRQ